MTASLKKDNNIRLLDCTLRDGGQLLEAHKPILPDRKFGIHDICKIAGALSKAGINVIELGFVNPSHEDYREIALFPNIESISSCIPGERANGQLFSALFPDPDYPKERIPEHRPNYCDVVRVILRYSELKKSLDFCRMLADKGYIVFIQPMVTARYTAKELEMVLDTANEIQAGAVYFVDSYGYMTKENIRYFFEIYNQRLHDSISVGFHAHNNMSLAFSNAISFLNIHTKRNRIVDSCLIGMGQGAGNLQTELISNYMIEQQGKNYNYEAILHGCEIIEKLWTQNLWGYSVTMLLSAINKTAYKFAESLRNDYHLTFATIYKILKGIPEELRHRYTKENTLKLLELNHLL